MVYIYIASLTLANLLVAWLGPWFSPINAFVLIGLDLSLRDKLHDRWQGKNLPVRMGAMILAAGVLSYVINQDAGMIAIASVTAFVLSQLTDSAIYQKLRNKSWRVRANGSNVGGAAVDSLVFPLIAFGGFLPHIVVMQFLAKVAGGYFWSLILDSLPRNTNNAQA
jgi:queuosine precursor transporter